jgi:hypothetical protein
LLHKLIYLSFMQKPTQLRIAYGIMCTCQLLQASLPFVYFDRGIIEKRNLWKTDLIIA